MTSSQQIRRQYLDFFIQKHGHTFVQSSSVVPLDDPTLLFTNAGMNQFKPIFLGQEKRDYTRAVNTQKCIRAGGKHNDLDDVGRSRRHHTFFEMLGNWSFGDYFKRGAIEMAWELLTQVWKLDPSRLHVSCYEGNPEARIPRDTEAADLWKEIAHLPDSQIHYFGKDNFWEMGDTGPCGPCTEIYVDRTPDKTGGPQVNGDDPRVMEIWNLVFIQYNRDITGKLTPLPAQHVDTGMGFERICQVLQGKDDNFGIDLWEPLFGAISQRSGLKYTGKFPKTNSADPVAEGADAQLRHDIAFRVVADHIRCLTFALTDGATPTNEGRGYVLRRILRRAVRFGRQQLGLTEPFLHTLVPVVVESMSGAFPELKKNPQRIIDIVKDEEISFGRTLDRGIELIENVIKNVTTAFEQVSIAAKKFNISVTAWTEHSREKILPAMKRVWAQQMLATDPNSEILPSDTNETKWAKIAWNHYRRFYNATAVEMTAEGMSRWYSNPSWIPAEAAFKLHDTYGFPIDLTRIMAEERGLAIDVEGYEQLMEKARERARSGGKENASSVTDLPPDALAQLATAGIKPTDDQPKFGREPIAARVMAIWNGSSLDQNTGATIEPGEEVAVILDRTSFYATMGGQVGDDGEIRTERGDVFEVLSTKAVGGYVLHIGQMRKGSLTTRDAVTVAVSAARLDTMRNHTSTHLLNWALRQVLQSAVDQKGSLVDATRLRFDFSHDKPVTPEQLAEVERLVNQKIYSDLPVSATVMPLADAKKIAGVRAVFGEKYPDPVRVIAIGTEDPRRDASEQMSIEFCGGTHLHHSGEAGFFKIVAEESVSKGVRRITAVTGRGAVEFVQNLEASARQLAQGLSSTIDDAPKRLAALQEEVRTLKKKLATGGGGGGAFDVQKIGAEISGKLGSEPAVAMRIDGASSEQLLTAIDSVKKRMATYAVMLASVEDEKVSFVAAVSDDLIARGLRAGDWIRETAKVAGGGGGGRPQMAQAGGKDPSKVDAALQTARDFAGSKLG